MLVDGRATEPELDRLREGVSLDDGLTAPARVRALRSSGGTTYCEIAIREGRKRQVRRMFSAVGHPVLELHRVRFGPIELGDLSRASWRVLDDARGRGAARGGRHDRGSALMALVVFTGGARSGKSAAAQALARRKATTARPSPRWSSAWSKTIRRWASARLGIRPSDRQGSSWSRRRTPTRGST